MGVGRMGWVEWVWVEWGGWKWRWGWYEKVEMKNDGKCEGEEGRRGIGGK